MLPVDIPGRTAITFSSVRGPSTVRPEKVLVDTLKPSWPSEFATWVASASSPSDPGRREG